jgi:hypothetical protein
MTELDNIVQAMVAIFIVLLLGYVFYTALSVLSFTLALVFAIAIVIVVIGLIVKLIRG